MLSALKMKNSKHRKVTKQIEYLVSKVLDIDKRKIMAVEDLSLLNSEEKDEFSTTNTVRKIEASFLVQQALLMTTVLPLSQLELGPPFSPFEFTSVPVQSYIPLVKSMLPSSDTTISARLTQSCSRLERK